MQQRLVLQIRHVVTISLVSPPSVSLPRSLCLPLLLSGFPTYPTQKALENIVNIIHLARRRQNFLSNCECADRAHGHRVCSGLELATQAKQVQEGDFIAAIRRRKFIMHQSVRFAALAHKVAKGDIMCPKTRKIFYCRQDSPASYGMMSRPSEYVSHRRQITGRRW